MKIYRKYFLLCDFKSKLHNENYWNIWLGSKIDKYDPFDNQCDLLVWIENENVRQKVACCVILEQSIITIKDLNQIPK